MNSEGERKINQARRQWEAEEKIHFNKVYTYLYTYIHTFLRYTYVHT